ncbi:MAG: hypothetical protein FJ225_02750 [Lentisphaerae bacterium]|nr:hypothetical protein [Lentisphaerota bacterium]
MRSMKADRKMRKKTVLAAVSLIACAWGAARPSGAAQVKILDFTGAGSLAWTNDFSSNATYYVSESSSLVSGWTTNYSGYQPARSLVTESVSVSPSIRFFRVSARPVDAVDPSLWKAVDLDTNWFGGEYPWSRQTAPLRPGGDGDVAQSYAGLPDGKESWFGAMLEGPIDLSFWWRVDCEMDPNTDFLAFYLDGVEQARIFGFADWTNVTRGMGPGSHLAVWKYSKDSNSSNGADLGWVDGITNLPLQLLILDGDTLSVTTPEDTPTNIRVRAYVQSGTSSWGVAQQASWGLAVTSQCAVTSCVFRYTPNTNWFGADSFVGEVTSGSSFDQITINVTVTPVNDAPVINNGSNTVTVVMDEDSNPRPFALTLTASDVDTPGTNIEWFIAGSGATPSGVASVQTGSGSSQQINYAPLTNWNTYTGNYAGGVPNLANGSYVTFTVRAQEKGGGPSDTIDVRVEIVPRNDPPTNMAPPVIGGTANVAKTLFVSVPGVYADSIDVTGTPTQYLTRVYQWQVGNSGGGPWTDIAGAMAAVYTVQSSDYLKYVRVREAARDLGEGLPYPTQSVWTASNVIGPMGAADPGDLVGGERFVVGGWVMLGDGQSIDTTQRLASITSFFMDGTEVPKTLWDEVRTWATNGHGYTDLPEGRGGTRYVKGGAGATNTAAGVSHPVVRVSWYDCAKWCNARSEKEGFTPAYYAGYPFTSTNVYRSGTFALTSDRVNWSGNGYRLPTDAEWETAARGGLVGNVFPWGNTIGGSNANYRLSGDPFEEGTNNVHSTTPVAYYDGAQTPAGPDMANGFGLYDMAGNVAEWCWDRYASPPEQGATDPTGPDDAQYLERMTRGGAYYEADDVAPVTDPLRCADRSKRQDPGWAAGYDSVGFRTVRRH